MKSKNPYDTPRALQALIKAGDQGAIDHVVEHVKAAGGSIRGASESLGVSDRTIGNWRAASPKLDRALDKVALGRTGAGKRAGEVRMKRLARGRRLH